MHIQVTAGTLAGTASGAISEMVSIIGNADFGGRFFGIVARMIGADHCTVFVSNGAGVRTLVAEARSRSATERVRQLAGAYSARGYRADPVWNRRAIDATESGVHAKLIAPGDFEDRAYRREFYEKPNILEEIALSADMGGGRRVYASFYREQGRARFSDDDLATLQASAPVTLQVLAKQAEITGTTEAPRVQPLTRDELYRRVKQAILEDNGLLTPREAEVCTGIILGYTILGLSLNMGISVNTVATHRKRAYAKLHISSQNELFAHYFALVESMS